MTVLTAARERVAKRDQKPIRGPDHRIQFPRSSLSPRLEKRADPSRVSWLRVRATLRPSNRVRTNVDSRGLFSLYSPVTQKAEREGRLMNEFFTLF